MHRPTYIYIHTYITYKFVYIAKNRVNESEALNIRNIPRRRGGDCRLLPRTVRSVWSNDLKSNQIKYDFNNGLQTATKLQHVKRDKITVNKRRYVLNRNVNT